ncbi:hypothetical protein M3Y99_00458400 [Aphelenchoides fujianensis]|nr:hypothetical protein M3Y99_00458400 [Aphelenchoides fujianensis]
MFLSEGRLFEQRKFREWRDCRYFEPYCGRDVISADVLDTQCVHFKFGGQAGGNPSLYHHKIAFSRRV